MNYLLLVVLPNFGCVLGCITILGLIALAVLFMIIVGMAKDGYCQTGRNDDKEKDFQWFLTIFSRLAISLLIVFLASCFIPSKTEVLQLKAISVLSEVKGAHDIPQKLIDKLNDLLDVDKK